MIDIIKNINKITTIPKSQLDDVVHKAQLCIAHEVIDLDETNPVIDLDIGIGILSLVYADDNITYRFIQNIGDYFPSGYFTDDFIKAVKKRNEGLNPKQKILFQVVFCSAFLAIMYALGDHETTVDLLFCKLNLGIFYYPVMLLFMIYMINAVNLTDGIDGLCGSVTVVTMLCMTILCSTFDALELSLYAITIAGGCIGFLVWNLHPAKCFMGDTGSMYLGGAFAALGVACRMHLLLVMVGIVYVRDALSVVIQTLYFKYTRKKYGEGRRIFKMSPIHHHFELCKWSEYKIVTVFSLFGLVFGVLAVATRM